MQHKILFTGSIDAGKTTLANHFATYPQIYIVPETVRELIVIDPSVATKPEFQDVLFREQIFSAKYLLKKIDILFVFYLFEADL
ncbi:hypothetical protein A2955_03370 [Candidatus Woesebacteria bacterium RIFCSPLOWO2_01_FULL_37_19]|uniref:Uncharacterized protein n=1 Tax=Candidatus Woesebacteria bacterium RIFCSPLOWO2_01_FULL_37_19 TaxID=1802514 RepID=A0A1F8B8B5_9BACT|nr:MAG: hypothetical protein A2955_03370 [Candidatus Woesebacteria bacterium RIFCSPLOWO2_01_FULL_37_19]